MMNKRLIGRIHNAARTAYRIIEPELFRAAETKVLCQSEIIKYVGMYFDYCDDPKAVQAFHALSEEDKTRLLMDVFPEKEYHWE